MADGNQASQVLLPIEEKVDFDLLGPPDSPVIIVTIAIVIIVIIV